MAVAIKPRRTAVAGKVPTTADLEDGELAVNTVDRVAYIRQGSNVQQLGAQTIGFRTIAVVTALPASPDPQTLYMVTG